MNSILLVDDSKTVLCYISSALQKQGYEVITVDNGDDALQTLKDREDIQFVISDLMMPGISGVELCRKLKSNFLSRYIFFVLLSSKNDQNSVIKGMDSGADDFIDKKTSVGELQARIRAGFRTLSLHNMLMARNQELDSAYQMIQKDLDAASELMEQLLPTEEHIHSARFNYAYLPCSKIGGDMLGYIELDDEHVAFYLFDVSGHGISAALMAFSIQQTLSQKNKTESITLDWSEEGTRIRQPEEVVERLNRRYQQNSQSQIYFTIEYAILNTKKGQLQYCTAGHPKFIWQKKYDKFEQIGDDNFMVGMLEPMIYQSGRLQMEPRDTLWFFSDGLLEARKDKSLFGMDRLIMAIERAQEKSHKNQANVVLEEVQKWQNKAEMEDDVSLLRVSWLGPQVHTLERPKKLRMERLYYGSLENSRIASKDVAVFLNVQSIPSTIIQTIELCIVELMNNAFIHSYQEQEEKKIELVCEVFKDSEQKVLINVTNFGEPIEESLFLSYISKEIQAPNIFDETSWLPSGRGLMLITQMTDDFYFRTNSRGNTF
ncbi:response regulator, partial [Vibrio agarivorans]